MMLKLTVLTTLEAIHVLVHADMIIPTTLLCKSDSLDTVNDCTRCRPASERWGRRCTWGGRGRPRRTRSSGQASWRRAPVAGDELFSADQSEWWSVGRGRGRQGKVKNNKVLELMVEKKSLGSDICSLHSQLVSHTHTHLYRQACSRGQLPAWFTVELVNPDSFSLQWPVYSPSCLPTWLQLPSTVSIQQINNRVITVLAHGLVLPWACVLKVNSRCLLTKISTVFGSEAASGQHQRLETWHIFPRATWALGSFHMHH